MKIICISDTHGCHRELVLPKGDMLVHAGDICNKGNYEQVEDFVAWFTSLDFQYKIFIRGNHDWDKVNDKTNIPSQLPEGIIFLENDGIEIEGIKIFGVPYQDDDLQPDYSIIPADTDIVITHNPPYEIHDKSSNGLLKGSLVLREKIFEVKPKLHLFGHIHVSYGQSKIDDILFINSSNYEATLESINRAPIIYNYQN